MGSSRRALLSVSDKSGIVDFAKGLEALGFELVSTGGTMAKLQEAGIAVRAVSDVTGVPEILGGRVKTLHPAVFGGILARRQLGEDMATLEEHSIGSIDVVAVNLYPFEETVAKEGATDPEIIEQIDIGGPSLLRAAAKNHRDVYPIVDPADYAETLRVLQEGREAENRDFRRGLAGKVFEHCSRYDAAISAYIAQNPEGGEAAPALPSSLQMNWPLTQELRYGENPQQTGGFYADPAGKGPSLAHSKQLQGKALSYNNYLDGEAALEMVREYDDTAAVILKHANPCGVGLGATPLEAYERALSCDSLSAFGGIVGLNRPCDAETATAFKDIFLEVIIAPSFTGEAQEILAKKKNLRCLETGPLSPREPGWLMRSVSGGVLVQGADWTVQDRAKLEVKTKAQPSEEDIDGLLFAWKVVRWVKSNAIVYADRTRTLGIGAGQMSRIDAAKFGLEKAEYQVKGAYLASDAFFPFRDVVDLVAEHGIKAIIQPGGSIRDEESIAAADEHGIAMVFTGERHFRH